MRRVVVFGIALLGCSDRPVGGEDELADDASDESTGDSEDTLGIDGSEGSDSDTGGPMCNPFACPQICERTYDECGVHMSGACNEQDECVCTQTSDCAPCLEETCGPYELCWEPYSLGGECLTECWYEFVYAWDAELGCTITIPADVPDWLFNSWFLDIDGNPYPRGETCDEDPESWVFDTRTRTISLCPAACIAFETLGQLVTGWGFPCE